MSQTEKDEWEDWLCRQRFGEPRDELYPAYDLRWVAFIFWSMWKFYQLKWKYRCGR